MAEVSLLQQRVGVAEAALGMAVGEIGGAIGFVVVNGTCLNDVLQAAVTRVNVICDTFASIMQGLQNSGACEEQVCPHRKDIYIYHNAGFRVNNPIVLFPAVVGHGCYAAHGYGVHVAE